MTLRWDLVAWNQLAARVFRDYSTIPPGERNLLRIILTDERYQNEPDTYELLSRKLLADFRVDFGQCSGDPAFERLIVELHESIPGFARRWENVEVSSAPRVTSLQDDELGDLHFDRISYVPEHSPGIRQLMFVPAEPNTARIVASLREPLPTTGGVVDLQSARNRLFLRHTKLR